MPCCPNSLLTQFSIDTLTLCCIRYLWAGTKKHSVTCPHETGAAGQEEHPPGPAGIRMDTAPQEKEG